MIFLDLRLKRQLQFLSDFASTPRSNRYFPPATPMPLSGNPAPNHFTLEGMGWVESYSASKKTDNITTKDTIPKRVSLVASARAPGNSTRRFPERSRRLSPSATSSRLRFSSSFTVLDTTLN